MELTNKVVSGNNTWINIEIQDTGKEGMLKALQILDDDRNVFGAAPGEIIKVTLD